MIYTDGTPTVAFAPLPEQAEPKGDWLAVYITGDGPFVEGPFETSDDAHRSILDFYQAEYGLTVEEADDRYANSGDEWVTRLHSPENA